MNNILSSADIYGIQQIQAFNECFFSSDLKFHDLYKYTIGRHTHEYKDKQGNPSKYQYWM